MSSTTRTPSITYQNKVTQNTRRALRRQKGFYLVSTSCLTPQSHETNASIYYHHQKMPPPLLMIPQYHQYIYHHDLLLIQVHHLHWKIDILAAITGELGGRESIHSTSIQRKTRGLQGWLLQMDDFMTMIQIMNQRQKLAYVGLCMMGEALEWWKANRHRHHIWVGVKEAIKTYYGNDYEADYTYHEIVAVKQTSTV